jgi:hypothetical protein
MSTLIQIKRSSTAGITPNTTNSANASYIAAGELALNLTDQKLFSSNGSTLIEFGTGTPVYDANGALITNTYVPIVSLSGISTNVVPSTDNLYTIGQSSYRFTQGFFSNNILLGNSSVNAELSSTTLKINNKQAINGPAFSAYPNSSIQQTISSGSQQKVLFQLEEYDTDANFANSRFTPTVAGYYQLNATVRMSGTMGTGESMIVIWKNGSEHKRGWNASGTEVGANFFAMSVSTLVYANGTGDYFEVYVQQGSGSDRDVTVAGGNITWFNGAMIRGA